MLKRKTQYLSHLSPILRPVRRATASKSGQCISLLQNQCVRFYAKKKGGHTKSRAGTEYHLPKNYRPSIPTPHNLSEDLAAALAEREVIAKETETADISLSIDEVRRKANIKKNMEKLLEDLATQNEDPIIRRAYEELEDEERAKKGLPPLKRAPPGRIRYKHEIISGEAEIVSSNRRFKKKR